MVSMSMRAPAFLQDVQRRVHDLGADAVAAGNGDRNIRHTLDQAF